MSALPNAIPILGPTAREVGEELYKSATTIIRRADDGSAAQRMVCKEYLGPHALRRLASERDLLLRLAGTEGIVQLADGLDGEGVLGLQDCEGVPLSQWLKARSFEPREDIAVALQLARAVAAMHRAGVIHRDINPANVLVTKDTRAVLIDFDLAVLADECQLTLSGNAIVGTLGYLAPEQTGRTGRAVDLRADLYALGATFYEMATGRLPFESTDMLQLVHDHLVREPAAPSQVDPRVPQGLSNIILRLLAKAPEQRYQSAEGLAHDLRRLLEELKLGHSSIFELCERDFPSRLVPPPRLVGRDKELAALRDAFTHALGIGSRTVLIEGAAGAGKSALIEAFTPEVAAVQGLIVRGKCDQYQREGASAGAVTQALRNLGRLLLAQPADAKAAHRRRILQALGRSAGLITRWLPEFALLLGEQAEVPEIDPRQAEMQLQQAIVELIAAVASPQCPLVMVLDDLQWASAVALRTFERLMGEPLLRGLFLIGAYRTQEADASQVLASLLADCRQHFLHIALSNLDPADTSDLIGQVLRLAPQPASHLTQAVRAFTAGNPFDTVEMLNALRREGVLRLLDAGWQWDDEKVRRFIGRGDVVDLLAARIARLTAASRELLECMSCMDNAVEQSLLRAATGLDDAALKVQLHALVEDGLLVSAGDREGGVRFRHDRVQQAVLGAMSDAQRGERHLLMARRLAGDPALREMTAQQYLACIGALLALDAPVEKTGVARLFLGQAQELARRAAWQLAENYLVAAGALLAGTVDPDAAALRGAVDAARHAALYSLGRLAELDDIYASLQLQVADALELVEPTCLQIRSLDMRWRMPEAMALGLGLLGRLGREQPPDPTGQDTIQRWDALLEWARQESRLDPSARRPIEDRRLLAVARLLHRTIRPSYYLAETKTFAWLLTQVRDVWCQHGPCAELLPNLCHLGAALISHRQAYRVSYDMDRYAVAVGEVWGWEPQTSDVYFVSCNNTGHWFDALEAVLRKFTRAYEGIHAAGDMSYVANCHGGMTRVLLELAPTLDTCIARADDGVALSERTGNLHSAAVHSALRQLLHGLRAPVPPADLFDGEPYYGKANAPPMGNALLPALYRSMYALLLGDVETLSLHAPRAMSLIEHKYESHYTAVQAHLFCTMAWAWQLQRPTQDAGRKTLVAQLDTGCDWLTARAADQPTNFLHLACLVQAERAWALGDLALAGARFDAALVEAQSRQRPWHQALITERAGLFQLTHGLTYTGRKLLAEACEQYQAWGATVKVAQMQREHAFLQTRMPHQEGDSPVAAARHTQRSGTVTSDALDLMGVLRASQALSSETGLERLTARVTEVLAALSGATRVLVLLHSDDQWRLLAPAPDEASIPLAQAAARCVLPSSVLAYAESTREPLIVDDAAHDDRFARDPYFAGVPLCSLLVAPIASQGIARAMLYLENTQVRSAFSGQRLDAVMLIAGQLAVSLANAQLYASLEERVQARTRELRETQAQLVATARRAGKAEIANNVLHNVGNVLNSVNVSASVVRRTLSESRVDGLGRAVELMNQHAGDLGGFLSSDRRGKALLPYLNEVVGALRSERELALGDLDRVLRSVDLISHVVATQQSLAGPSSVVETVKPQLLLEESLRLSAEAITRAGVTVVRRYEEVPPIALDQPRMLQIMVNLIVNAAQAMAEMPEDTRRLTLGTAVARADSGECLRITVQDQGEGISLDNLKHLFAHGFTTRKNGHGFGLHSSALAALEIGGQIKAHSDGPGQGAVFTLELPMEPVVQSRGDSPQAVRRQLL